MMRLLLLLLIMPLAGCSGLSQDEINDKVGKCTAADMEYTIMKDFRGKPVDVICVRKHPNEK